MLRNLENCEINDWIFRKELLEVAKKYEHN